MRKLLAPIVAALLLPDLALADESSVLETAINVPEGPGSIEGFGQGYDVAPTTGVPRLSYDIAVPPGRAGHAPALALRYDAAGGSSVFGLGWDVTIPRIERSTTRGIPRYDAADTYALRGLGSSEDLVEVAPGEWRESIEGVAPLDIREVAGGVEVIITAGIVHTFGASASARLQGPDGVFCWELERVTDTFGNTIEYEWGTQAGTDRPLLSRIEYNDGAAEIVFDYASRPDRVVSRAAGFEVVLEHRLQTISTRADGQAVQTWTLGYQSTTEVPSSLLVEIASEAADGTKLPTWQMEYASMLAEGDPISVSNGPQMDPTGDGRAWVDVDGDSLPDLLEGQAGQWRYRRNRGGERLEDWAQLPKSPSVTVGPKSRFADLNGDGVQDLLFQITPGDTDYFGFLGGEALFGESEDLFVQASIDIADPRVALVDLNLDSRIDILFSEQADAFVWLREFDAPAYLDPDSAPPLPQNLQLGDPGVSLADMNGDRLPDLVRVMPEDDRVIVADGEGFGLFGTPWDMSGVPAMGPTDRWELRDINEDGAADLVRVGSQTVELWVNQLDDSFAMAKSISWPELDASEVVIFTDVNANGTTDLLRVDTAGGNGWRYWDVLGHKPGLLRRFENGLGYSIEFEYSSAGIESTKAEDEGDGWASFAPQAMPLLISTTEDDGVDWARSVDLEFRDGWFDPRKQEFRGFGELTETRLGDEHLETQVSRGVYDLGKQDEATKNQLLVQEMGAPGELISRTENTLTVFDPAPGVTVARTTATDTWSVERGPMADALRIRVELDYDDWGNLLETREFGRVDPDSGADIVGDERITTNVYASPTGGSEIRNRVAETTVTDGDGNVAAAVRVHYDGVPEQGLAVGQVDAQGAATREETWISGGEWVDRVRRSFDEYGNVARIRDAEGGTLERGYDDLGRFPILERKLLDETSPLDELETRATWDAGIGQLTSITDPNDVTTTVQYDGLGRPTAIVRPGDSNARPTIRWTYYLAGETEHPSIVAEARRVSGTDDVEISVDQLDGLGRPRQRLTQDDNGAGAVLGESRTYDPDGNLARGHMGQFVSADYLTPGSLLEPQAAWPVAEQWRDALGRTVRARSEEGYETTETYLPLAVAHRDNEDLTNEGYADTPRVTTLDGLGRTISIVDRLTNRDITHAYAYDASDRLLSHVDPAGWKTAYTYGGDGRLLTVDSPDSGPTSHEYDARGLVTARTDATGARVDIVYDIIGRPILERGIGPNDEDQGEYRLYYDEARQGDSLASKSHAAGQLGGIDDPAGKLDFVYDARGRVSRATRAFAGAKSTVTLATGFEYDAQDRVVKELYPDGSELEFEFSQRGLATSVGDFATLTWDALGRATDVEMANGALHERAFDREGRVLGQRVSKGDTIHFHLEHAYDVAGLLESTTDGVGKTDDTPALDQSFEYDDLRRLVAAQADYGELSWTYADDGNLLTHSGRKLTYGGSAPHAATKLDDQSLAYDDAGQLAEVSGDGLLQEGTWAFDAWSRVSEFEHADGRRIEHVYDHEGQRVIKREYDDEDKLVDETLYFGNSEVRDGRLIKWVFVAGERLAETPEDMPKDGFPELPVPEILIAGLVVDRGRRRLKKRSARWWRGLRDAATALAIVLASLWAASCGCKVSDNGFKPGKDTRWHIQDRLTSAALILDHEGEPITRSASRPYGEKWVDWRAGKNIAPSDYRFTDKEDDAASGAVYIGARHYLPELGRWASPDPLLRTDELKPEDRNPFSYLSGDPIRTTDPTGLCPDCKNWTPPMFQPGADPVRQAAEKADLDTLQGSLDGVSIALDASGIGGAVSWAPDLLNAVISVARGDKVGAGMSAAAALPFLGISANMAHLGRLGDDFAGPAGTTIRNAGGAGGGGGGGRVARATKGLRHVFSKQIADGHAFKKHVVEGGEFTNLGITTREQFAQHLDDVVESAMGTQNQRNLMNSRTAYWDDASGTVVIHNPNAADGGTAFRPTQGRQYFENLN